MSKGVYLTHLLERLLHGHESWEVRLDQGFYPAEVVIENDRIGLRIKGLRLDDPVPLAPVLVCNGQEVWWNEVVTFPPLVREFTWWFSLQPMPV